MSTLAEPMPVFPSEAAELQLRDQQDLLRFSTAGSVDDGKSTLIGRLLFDSRTVYEDQLAAAQKSAVNAATGQFEFALLTDGLRAEREQGITIDVAYRYFSTPKRKFIIADTPGHEQYTRNMATGSSTANLTIVLIDARKGVLSQSRRHAFVASLLGIPHFIVAVNKMDLVGFSEEVFESIRRQFLDFAPELAVTDIHFIPISALHGDNVVDKSARMPWFQGASLLRYLETVHIASDRNLREMRFPVQYVIRPNLDFRGYAGQIASGIMKRGDQVMVLPSRQTTRVRSIISMDGELERAFPPMSVTVCLEDEVDLSRGDMLVHPGHLPHVTRLCDARLVWMSSSQLRVDRQYVIKHTTNSVKGWIRGVRHRFDVNTFEKHPASTLDLNDIGTVLIETHRPLYADAYRRNRMTGSVIVIDPLSNETVACGMITGRTTQQSDLPIDGVPLEHGAHVDSFERSMRYGHTGALVFLHGSLELAQALERKLFDAGSKVTICDCMAQQDNSADVLRALTQAGLITICPMPEAGAELVEHLSALVGISPIEAHPHSDDMSEAADQIFRTVRDHCCIPSVSFEGGAGTDSVPA